MQVIARDIDPLEDSSDQTLEETASLRARLRETPADQEARVSLARSLLERGDLSDAFVHLRIALAPGEQRGQATYLMGLAHICTGDHSAAVDDLLLAVRLLPAYAPAMAALDKALAGIVEPPAFARCSRARGSLRPVAGSPLSPQPEVAHSAAA
jgi:Flp pilus assembly protein TadD